MTKPIPTRIRSQNLCTRSLAEGRATEGAHARRRLLCHFRCGRLREVVMFFLLGMPHAGHTQDLPYPPTCNFLKSFAAEVGGDAWYIFSAPSRASREDGLQLLAFTAMTAVCVGALDHRIDASFVERDDAYVISAIALAKQYDRWWIEIPAYALAAAVALQRLDSRNHWGADVIVGGALGYGVGNALVARHHKGHSRRRSASPQISANGIGLSVTF